MSDESKQPLEYDAVLGGIEGVKRKLESKDDRVKIAALKQALNYGDRGLDLVIRGLDSESFAIQKAAYCLLRKRKEKRAIEAIKEFNKYHFFECKLTIPIRVYDFFNTTITNDGEQIGVCTDGDTTIKILSLKTGEILKTLRGHTKQVNCVVITNDDENIVSASEDSTIKIWSLKTGQLLKTINTDYPRDYLKISSDEKYIVATTDDGGYDRIEIFDFKTGKLLYYLNPLYNFDRETGKLLQYLTPGYIRFHSPVITNDGENVIIGIVDNYYHNCNIAIWNFKTDSLLNVVKGYWIENLAIDKKDRFIVTDDGKLWDIKTGKFLQTLAGGLDDFDCIAIGNNDETVVSGSCPTLSGGCPVYVKIWDVKTGKLLRTLTGHSDVVLSVAITNDGETIVSGSMDKTIKIWGLPEI